VYLEDQGVMQRVVAHKDAADSPFTIPAEPAGPVIDAAFRQVGPVLRAEMSLSSDAAAHEALTSTGWALALPLFADEKLVGLIAVGRKCSGDPFFSEDLDALATLANHAGAVVRNAQLYAQVVVANEYVYTIVAAMPNGILVLDASGTVTLMNPSARELLGSSYETRLKIDDLPPALRTSVESVLVHERETSASELTLSQDGSAAPRFVLCSVAMLPPRGTSRAGAVIVFSDVTPLKELETQRARAENLSNLQRLTQAIAHEIGNPLVPIKTMTKLLPERVGDRVFADKLTRIVSREIERIESLVARLRRVAPSTEGNYSTIDLRVPLHHAVELVEASATDYAINLESRVPVEPVWVLADSAEMEELFLNLLTNALEAVTSHQGGSRFVRATIDVDVHGVVVGVSDTGPGIAEDVIGHIFDPFVSTKARGSGLGLAICAGIAERHHGQLSACNTGGGGALFTLVLPSAR
jgi:nitrogen fixation/metabolism regulation signal transduction histidine kinase